MLKKYAAGLAPVCMGLLFMGVGVLLIVLFSRQIVATDKKTYLPLVFGAVFALAGFLVAFFGSLPFCVRQVAARGTDADALACRR